jgi:hypothetical protein
VPRPRAELFPCRGYQALYDVRPRLAINEAQNGQRAKTKTRRKLSLERFALGINLTNLADTGRRQFRPDVCLTTGLTTIPNSIFLVANRRVPSQVRQAIVTRVVIVVATLHPVRTQANKCFKHNTMNEKPVPPRIACQTYPRITSAKAGTEPLPLVANPELAVIRVAKNPERAPLRPCRPDAAIVSHPVSGETLDWTVLNGRGRLSIRHDRAPRKPIVFRMDRGFAVPCPSDILSHSHAIHNSKRSRSAPSHGPNYSHAGGVLTLFVDVMCR